VYARTTLLEIDTVRMSMDDAVAMFESEVMPRLESQSGFCGVYVLTAPTGAAMLLTFWRTAAQANASMPIGWYPDVLTEYMTLFRSPPDRRSYDVQVARPPLTVKGAV
jgi:hypothetical protein